MWRFLLFHLCMELLGFGTPFLTVCSSLFNQLGGLLSKRLPISRDGFTARTLDELLRPYLGVPAGFMLDSLLKFKPL